MTRRIQILFLFTLLAPALCSIWAIVYHNFIQSGMQWKHLPYMLPGILAAVAIVTVPGALIFLAARLSRRASFTTGCLFIAVPFALLFSFLSLVLGGGMAFPVVAVLESLIAVIALLLAAVIRKSSQQEGGK